MHLDQRPRPESVWLAGPNLVERLAAPPVDTWGPPRAACAAWAAVHLTAVASVVTVVAAGAVSAGAGWRAIPLIAWAVVTSGLVASVARRILDPSSAPAVGARRLSPNLVAGCYLVISQLTFDLLRPVGSVAVIGFVALVVLSLGARTAGLDAWDGVIRPPGHYLRCLVDPRSIAPVVLFVATSAAVFWLASVTIDRIVEPGGIEWLVDPATDRRDQFLQFVLAVAVVTLPALGVCEGIAAVARFHQELDRLQADETRRSVRANYAQRVHNRALGKLDSLYRAGPGGIDVADLVDLEAELRMIESDFRDRSTSMSVAHTLDRGLQLANRAGVHVGFQPTRTAVTADLPPDTADVLESALLIMVSNSAKAGARTAELTIDADPARVALSYSDDAGGFDPFIALSKRRGLHDLQQRLEAIGGRLDFATGPRTTRTHVWAPR